MIAGHCTHCGHKIDLLDEEISLLQEGDPDYYVLTCSSCDAQLALKNPFNTSKEIEEVIQCIIKSIRDQETIVFCGTGISKHSGMPLSNDLVRSILEKLSVSEEEIETVINAKIPFEAFMAILLRGGDATKLLDIFGEGEPNINHVLLAKLSKKGYIKTIVTTNFDRLIEKAFEQQGLNIGEDYHLYYKEDDLLQLNRNDDKLILIKLHGSIEDRDEMAITVNRVANRVSSERRKNIVEHIFSKGFHKTVLVCGYSCSDVFDISQHLLALKDKVKEVFYIDHYPSSANRHRKEGEIEDLSISRRCNPFQNFIGSKRIFYDTDKILRAIWDSLINDEQISHCHESSVDWKMFVNEWSLVNEDKYSQSIKYTIAGTIFYEISEFCTSIKYYKMALGIARRLGSKPAEGINLGNLASINAILGNCHQAIEYYQQAIQIFIDIGNKYEEGSKLGGLGHVYVRLGYYEKAIGHYQRALLISDEIEDIAGAIHCLGGLGIANCGLGDYQQAILYHGQAIQLARVIGDKQSEVNDLGALGGNYRYLGEYQKAIVYIEEALEIAENIGDKLGTGNLLGNLGICYGGLKDYQRAIEYLEQAIQIASTIGDKLGEATFCGGAGSIHYKLGELQKAITYHKHALQLSESINDVHGKSRHLNNLGVVYANLGEYHKALKYIEESLTITRKLLGNDHPDIEGMVININLVKHKIDEGK